MSASTPMLHSVLAPWSEVTDDKTVGRSILADAWLIKDGKMIPYEFECSPETVKNPVDPGQYTVFIGKFMNTAAKAWNRMYVFFGYVSRYASRRAVSAYVRSRDTT